MATFPPAGPPSGPYPNHPPRRGPGPVVLVDCIREAWDLLIQDWSTWLVCTLIVVFGMQIIQTPISYALQFLIMGNPFRPQPFDLGRLGIFYAAFLPIAIVLNGLLMTMITSMVEMGIRRQEGYAIAVSDFFNIFKKFGPVYVTSLLQVVCATLGSLLCVLPGLYLAYVQSTAGIFALRQNLAPVEALKASHAMVKGQEWAMVGVLFLASLLSAAGILACCIGMLFTYPVYALTIAVIYYNFHQPEIASPRPPSEGFVNYPRGQYQPGGFVPGTPPTETPLEEPNPTPESFEAEDRPNNAPPPQVDPGPGPGSEGTPPA